MALRAKSKEKTMRDMGPILAELEQLRKENKQLREECRQYNEQYRKLDENKVALVTLIEDINDSAKFLKPEIAVNEIRTKIALARAYGVEK